LSKGRPLPADRPTFPQTLKAGDSEVRRIQRFGPGEQGSEGSVKRADFSVGGHNLIFFDSPVKHAFTFTPSISIFR